MKWTCVLFFIFISIHAGLPAQDSRENANFKLAVSLYNDKLYDLALEQFRTFIEMYPNTAQSVEARFYLGLTQSKLGKHEDARFAFQNFALGYPDHAKAPEAWMHSAEENAAMKNYREAALAYERVKTFYPKSKFAPIGLSKAAEFYDRIGDTENARRVLRSLTQEYSSAEILPARLRLAELFIGDKLYEPARQECKRVLDADGDGSLKARALLLMGKAYIGLGKTPEAESVLNEIVKKYRTSSSYYEALFVHGKSSSLSGNANEALASWGQIVGNESKAQKQLQQEVCLEIGKLYNRMHSFSNALAYFERAGDIKGTKNIEAFFNAGAAAEKAGDQKKEAEYYSRAFNESANITEDTAAGIDFKSIRIGAFKAAAIARDYTQAIDLVQQFRQKYPADPVLSRLLLEGARIAETEQEDPRTTIELCQWLVRHFPLSQWVDDAVYLQGEAWEKIGDMDKAVSEFESLKRLYPSSELIPEAQKRIQYINAFSQRDKDAGLQKLALLVGDVIAQKSKGNLAYRLAEIYFTDLKDYNIAAEQYSYALSVDLDDDLRPKAWLKEAQSYEMLALKEGENSAKGKEYLTRAVSVYDSLVVYFPEGEFTDQASVAAFKIRIKLTGDPQELQSLGTHFLAKSIGMRGKDAALLQLGDSYLESKNYESAIITYRFILSRYASSDVAPFAKYNLGIVLDRVAEKDSAVLVLDQFLSKNQNHIYAAASASYLAKAAADSGNVSKALRYLALIEKRYYYSSFVSGINIQKANVYFKNGGYTQAIDEYQNALEKLRTDPFIASKERLEEPVVLYRLGLCSDKLGDRESARKWYSEYILMDQTSEMAGQAFYALASIAKAENDMVTAAKFLQKAGAILSKAGSKHTSIAFETAEMLYRDENYSEAIVKYEDALAQAENDTLKQYLLSRIVVCYFRSDNLKEGDSRAALFLKSNRGSLVKNYTAEFEFERGKYQIRKGDLGKARERFFNVLRAYPKTPVVPETIYWLARVYELDEKAPQAAKLYDSLIHKFPNEKVVPRAKLSLGNVYYSLENWESAAKQYRDILDHEEKSPDLVPLAMSNLIMTYKEVGLWDAALDLTRKYIERFPDDSEIIDKKIDIGIIYQKLSYYDQSILQLQSLIDAGNSGVEGELRYYIGEAYYYKGEYQQAILEFLKVPYLVTRRGKIDWNSTSYYMAGQSYEKMSKFDQAITMYRQIIERKDTDGQFKAAAQKEIDRVRTLMEKNK